MNNKGIHNRIGILLNLTIIACSVSLLNGAESDKQDNLKSLIQQGDVAGVSNHIDQGFVLTKDNMQFAKTCYELAVKDSQEKNRNRHLIYIYLQLALSNQQVRSRGIRGNRSVWGY